MSSGLICANKSSGFNCDKKPLDLNCANTSAGLNCANTSTNGNFGNDDKWSRFQSGCSSAKFIGSNASFFIFPPSGEGNQSLHNRLSNQVNGVDSPQVDVGPGKVGRCGLAYDIQLPFFLVFALAFAVVARGDCFRRVR